MDNVVSISMILFNHGNMEYLMESLQLRDDEGLPIIQTTFSRITNGPMYLWLRLLCLLDSITLFISETLSNIFSSIFKNI